jgi:hypothetical protein
VYNVNEEWENKYSFIQVNNKYICFKRDATLAVSNKYNIKQHFMTMHTDCITKYTDNSEICRNKVGGSNRNLQLHEAMFICGR